MAHHKSALKRIRQNERLRVHNRNIKSATRSMIRKVRETIEEGNADNAQAALKKAISSLNRAASSGVIPKARASRRISRLAKHVHQLK